MGKEAGRTGEDNQCLNSFFPELCVKPKKDYPVFPSNSRFLVITLELWSEISATSRHMARAEVGEKSELGMFRFGSGGQTLSHHQGGGEAIPPI